jgi:hypothetical protein
MNTVIKSFILTIVLTSCTAQQIQQAQQALGDVIGEEKLTSQEVAEGLKEALIQGVSKGTSQLSRVNGYYKNPQIKIPFPPDVQKVEDKLRDIGLGNKVDEFIETLNRGAEEAAKEAGPVFVNAIKSMSINDAWGILNGNQDAATRYLESKTSNDLKTRFKPIIKRALDKTNATKYYTDIVTTYNKSVALAPGLSRIFFSSF